MLLVKPEDMNGARFYWEHFWWGLLIGGGLGTWISWGMFGSRLACISLASAIALFVGFCSGNWGDEFWHAWFENW